VELAIRIFRNDNDQDIKVMSALTQTLLMSIDYDSCANKRLQIFTLSSIALNETRNNKSLT
jgi:hypothetical protein